MNKYRTNNCGELNVKNVGQTVRLAGWIQKIRDLGQMKFIDLRDEFGITQIVVSNEIKLPEGITTECSISVLGEVVERVSKNPKMSTRRHRNNSKTDRNIRKMQKYITI